MKIAGIELTPEQVQEIMTAKQAGQRASLVEQERPNMFTSSLANIAPGESISVDIEYQQTVHYSDGAFRLRFPLVVGPRYIPGIQLAVEEQVSAFAGTGWAQATTQVADAARITINAVTQDVLFRGTVSAGPDFTIPAGGARDSD